jgi:hypothetical protein
MPENLKTCLINRDDDRACELVRTLPEDTLDASMEIEVMAPLRFAFPVETINASTKLDMTLLWFAARFNMPKTVEQLLIREVDPDQTSDQGSVPSHAAALFRYYERVPNDEVINLLVEGRAEFNLQDIHYCTAFDMFDDMGIEIPVPTWFVGLPSELRYCDPQCYKTD